MATERKRREPTSITKDVLNPHNIPVHRIKGFTEADGYVVTDSEVLEKKLKRLKLFGEEFGYRAFNPQRLGHTCLKMVQTEPMTI